MKRPSLVSQGSLNRIFQAVNEAWIQLDFQAAIELMERASRLNPSNSVLLLDLGRMHGLRYNYTAAERCFDQAVRLAPKKSEALLLAGQKSLDFGNFTMAERFLKLASEQKDTSASILVKLAQVCERLRRPEEAAHLVNRAMQLEAACAPARLLQARLERHAGRLEAAEHLLRTFPASSDQTIRANAAYELGGILDRQGRYDEAFRSFLVAKALLLPNAAPHVAELKKVRQRVRNLHAELTAETLQHWFAHGTALPPTHKLALLGGHPRSGTTLLEQALDSHPGITSAEETEVFHAEAYLPFTRKLPADSPMLSVLHSASTDALLQSRHRYFDMMAKFLNQPIDGRLLIDKNPSLTFLIPVLIRIFPEIKLLIALRDPRDVVLSCFMQPLPLGLGSSAYLTIESTVEEYTAMMNLWQFLKPMLPGHFLEVRYEDMVENLESVARRTLEFLDVPWDDQVLGFDAHARKRLVRSPTYADVTQPVYKRAVGRWHHYIKYLEPHLEKLEPLVKAFGYET